MFYWKRFAQSAGPGILQLTFFDALEPLWRSCKNAFCDLGGHFYSILGTLFHPWGNFWSTLGIFFVSKNRLGRQRPSKAPPRPPPRKSPHPFGHLLGPCLGIFLHFLIKKVGSEICHVFLWFWGRPGRSMGWAHMQSAHDCAVETHFSFFAFFLKNRLHMTSFWFHVGSVFLSTITILSEKERAPQNCWKKVTPLTQTAGY